MADAKRVGTLDVLNYAKRLQLISGYWPIPGATWRYKWKNVATYTLDFSIQIFLWGELYKTATHREYKELGSLVAIMMNFFAWIIKRTTFEFKKPIFNELMKKLADPVFHTFPKSCDVHIRRENFVVKSLGRFYQFLAVNMVLFATVNLLFTHTLTVQFSWIELPGAWFYVFHTYQVVVLASVCYNHSANDVLSMSLISFCSTQFIVLQEKLMNCRTWAGRTMEEIDNRIVNEEEDMDEELDEAINNYLNDCVKHHLKILDVVDDVEAIFSYLLLALFLTSVLGLCSTLFQLFWEDNTIIIIYLLVYTTAFLLQLILYCLFGDKVLVESSAVTKACFFAQWPRSNNKVRKTLTLIMERAKRPSRITAGKFAQIDMVAYSIILRNAFSYFTLVNKLYGT